MALNGVGRGANVGCTANGVGIGVIVGCVRHPCDVTGVLVLPRPARDSTAAAQATANACAGLTELHHFAQPETVYKASLDNPEPAFTTPEAPFDRTIVLPQTDAAADLSAELLIRELFTPFGRDLDARRAAAGSAEAAAIAVQTFGLARFAAPHRPLLDRAARQLDQAIEQHKGGRIAVFSHTGTICILALHLMGALDAPELRPVWITTANCGITRFELRSDGFVRVLAINDTRHLIGV